MTVTTINPEELQKFANMADEWWDPNGKFRPLHKFNPVRLGYIREKAIAHFGRDAGARRPLEAGGPEALEGRGAADPPQLDEERRREDHAVAEDRQPENSAADAARSVALVLAARTSAERGGVPVAVEDPS